MDKKQKREPSKSYREGIGIIELMNMFKDKDTARRWLESIMWKNGKAVCTAAMEQIPVKWKTASHWRANAEIATSTFHSGMEWISKVPIYHWENGRLRFIWLPQISKASPVWSFTEHWISLRNHLGMCCTEYAKHSRKKVDCSTARLKQVRLLLEDLKRTSMNQRN